MDPERPEPAPDGGDLRPLIPILLLILGGIATGFLLLGIVVARLFSGQP